MSTSELPSELRLRVYPKTDVPPWSAIKEAILVTSDTISCPICLDSLLVARLTPCGHFYCLPCLLKLFFPTPDTFDHYCSLSGCCAVCKHHFKFSTIKPLRLVQCSPIQINNPLSFTLLSHSHDPISPFLPKNPSLSNQDFLYSRITLFNNPLEIIDRDERELSVYQALRCDDEVDLQYVSFASYLIDLLNSELSLLNFELSRDHELFSLSSESSPHVLYIASSGLWCFLHPLYVHALISHFSLTSLPNSLTIIPTRIGTHSTNDERFKQYREVCGYNVSITLIHFDLEPLVSPTVYSNFQPKISRLLHELIQKDKREEREEQELLRKLAIDEKRREDELKKFAGIVDQTQGVPSKRQLRSLSSGPRIPVVEIEQKTGEESSSYAEAVLRRNESEVRIPKIKKGQKFKKIF
ncbi:hypothetical protein RCL1_005372 [Eukaryota sp. TZLM3-RCL]